MENRSKHDWYHFQYFLFRSTLVRCLWCRLILIGVCQINLFPWPRIRIFHQSLFLSAIVTWRSLITYTSPAKFAFVSIRTGASLNNRCWIWSRQTVKHLKHLDVQITVVALLRVVIITFWFQEYFSYQTLLMITILSIHAHWNMPYRTILYIYFGTC